MFDFKKLSEREKETIITLGVLSWFSRFIRQKMSLTHISNMKEMEKGLLSYVEQTGACEILEFCKIKELKTQEDIIEEAQRIVDRLDPAFYKIYWEEKKAIENKGKEVFRISKKELEDIQNDNCISLPSHEPQNVKKDEQKTIETNSNARNSSKPDIKRNPKETS